ncbi:MAG: replicative helicase, partial [Bacteroidota bacterium]|nr:replicative helicase [Bacteroidota bacterium]
MEQNTKRTRAKSVDFSTLVYGKIPPQAKELEEYIIGAMIMDDMFKVITDVREILKPEDFYVNAHQIIAKAIYALSEEGAVDIRLLAERLKKEEKLDEVGGVFAIMQFTNKVNNVTNIKNYCLIVKQKSVQRNLISFAGTILEKSYLESEDVFETLHEAENKLKGINNELAELKNVPLVDIASSI